MDPQVTHTFRGLPLTEEQNAMVNHYLRRMARAGHAVDEKEILGMLGDMLFPPALDDQASGFFEEAARGNAERAAGMADETMNESAATEDRNAAVELEMMRRV